MLGQNDVMTKMAGTEEYIDKEGDSKIKDFFEHVIRRTGEIEKPTQTPDQFYRSTQTPRLNFGEH